MDIKLFTNVIEQFRDSTLNRKQNIFLSFLEASKFRRYRESNIGRSNTGNVFYR